MSGYISAGILRLLGSLIAEKPFKDCFYLKGRFFAIYAVLLFFPGTPFLILVHLTAWAMVGYVEKKHHLN